MSNNTPESGGGCLSILFVLFLLDVIGKAIIFGGCALFGVQLLPFSKIVQIMAWELLAPFGIICIAIIGYWLYAIVADYLGNIFGKGKKDKDRPTGTSS